MTTSVERTKSPSMRRALPAGISPVTTPRGSAHGGRLYSPTAQPLSPAIKSLTAGMGSPGLSSSLKLRASGFRSSSPQPKCAPSPANKTATFLTSSDLSPTSASMSRLSPAASHHRSATPNTQPTIRPSSASKSAKTPEGRSLSPSRTAAAPLVLQSPTNAKRPARQTAQHLTAAAPKAEAEGAPLGRAKSSSAAASASADAGGTPLARTKSSSTAASPKGESGRAKPASLEAGGAPLARTKSSSTATVPSGDASGGSLLAKTKSSSFATSNGDAGGAPLGKTKSSLNAASPKGESRKSSSLEPGSKPSSTAAASSGEGAGGSLLVKTKSASFATSNGDAGGAPLAKTKSSSNAASPKGESARTKSSSLEPGGGKPSSTGAVPSGEATGGPLLVKTKSSSFAAANGDAGGAPLAKTKSSSGASSPNGDAVRTRSSALEAVGAPLARTKSSSHATIPNGEAGSPPVVKTRSSTMSMSATPSKPGSGFLGGRKDPGLSPPHRSPATTPRAGYTAAGSPSHARAAKRQGLLTPPPSAARSLSSLNPASPGARRKVLLSNGSSGGITRTASSTAVGVSSQDNLEASPADRSAAKMDAFFGPAEVPEFSTSSVSIPTSSSSQDGMRTTVPVHKPGKATTAGNAGHAGNASMESMIRVHSSHSDLASLGRTASGTLSSSPSGKRSGKKTPPASALSSPSARRRSKTTANGAPLSPVPSVSRVDSANLLSASAKSRSKSTDRSGSTTPNHKKPGGIPLVRVPSHGRVGATGGAQPAAKLSAAEEKARDEYLARGGAELAKKVGRPVFEKRVQPPSPSNNGGASPKPHKQGVPAAAKRRAQAALATKSALTTSVKTLSSSHDATLAKTVPMLFIPDRAPCSPRNIAGSIGHSSPKGVHSPKGRLNHSASCLSSSALSTYRPSSPVDGEHPASPFKRADWEYEAIPGVWNVIDSSFEVEFYSMGVQGGRLNKDETFPVTVEDVPCEVSFSKMLIFVKHDPLHPRRLRRVEPRDSAPPSPCGSVLSVSVESTVASEFGFLKSFKFGA